MTPYVSAAVGAYGGAVLARVRDDAADATVGLGRRLLQRIFGSRAGTGELPAPLEALAADPGDGDALAAVRLAIRRVLATVDPGLADGGAVDAGWGAGGVPAGACRAGCVHRCA